MGKEVGDTDTALIRIYDDVVPRDLLCLAFVWHGLTELSTLFNYRALHMDEFYSIFIRCTR